MGLRMRIGRARGRQHTPGVMNKTEAAYAAYLDLRQAAGEIVWYCFEGVKFKLAAATFYTPDFLIMLQDGVMVCDDVKGVRKGKPFCEDDAKAKIKVAADKYPFVFRIVWKGKTALAWESEEY